MQYFKMRRDVDETGNSGTGHVAEVVVGGPGTAIVLWSAESNALGVASVVIYESVEDLLAVHGHNGKTVLEPAVLDPERWEVIRHRLIIAQRKLREVHFGSFGRAISFSSSIA